MESRVLIPSYPCRNSIRTFSSESFLIWILWTMTMVPRIGGGGAFGGEQRTLTPRSPYIEPPHQLNLTVLIGQTAYLRCPVKYLGDKTVSFLRRRDLHILTSGNHIFTSDPRVSLLRDKGSWTLRLESVERKDDSPYECQINTEPKMRLAIFLTVVGSQNDEWVPPLGAQVDYRLRPKAGGEARILGPSIVRVQVGSVLELTCLVSHGDPPPSTNITWFHGQFPLPAPRPSGGGLEIQTSRAPFTTVSRLKIWRVQLGDGGKYLCGGDGVESTASIILQPLLIQQDGDDFTDVGGESSADGRLGNVSNSSGGRIQILGSLTITTTTIFLISIFLVS